MNINYVIESQLTSKDLCLIGLLDTISKEKNSDIFQYSYKEIIDDLPLVFKSKTHKANLVMLRRILDRKEVQKFVTREINKKGYPRGSIVTFTLNRKNIDKLRIEGIVK